MLSIKNCIFREGGAQQRIFYFSAIASQALSTITEHGGGRSAASHRCDGLVAYSRWRGRAMLSYAIIPKNIFKLYYHDRVECRMFLVSFLGVHLRGLTK